MKIILSEEQIKKLLLGRINEDNAGAVQAEPPYDHLKAFSDATSRIDNLLSAVSGGYAANDNDNDPMPNGPMAYADNKRQEYNSNLFGATNQNWLETVKNTFDEYKRKYNNRYSQQADPTSPNDRPDCSGFVFAALRNAGYNVGVGNTGTMINDPSFTNSIRSGFKRINWYGPADASKLPPGTILAYGAGENGKKYGHTLILGDNGTSYDYGKNGHTEYSPNLNQRYTAAWIPIA